MTAIPKCLVLEQNGREKRDKCRAVVFDDGHSFVEIDEKDISFEGDTAVINSAIGIVYPAAARDIQSDLSAKRKRWVVSDRDLAECRISESGEDADYKQRFAKLLLGRFADFEAINGCAFEIPASDVFDVSETYPQSLSIENMNRFRSPSDAVRYKDIAGIKVEDNKTDDFYFIVSKDDLKKSEDGKTYTLRSFSGQMVGVRGFRDSKTASSLMCELSSVAEGYDAKLEKIREERSSAKAAASAKKSGLFMER